jgi:hypothetical protein
MRRAVPFTIVACCVFAGPAWSSGGSGSCAVEWSADRLQSLSAEGDLVLEKAGLARLVGIRLPDGAWPERVVALLREQVGREVQVAGADARDRWGRRALHLGAGAPPDETDFGRTLVAQGLAMVDSRNMPAPCGRALLRLEAAARTAGLGLWAGDRYKPIPAGDVARLNERIGRFVLVEGRIRSVGERASWTYLNFSGDWSTDFTVVVPKRIWDRTMGQQPGAASLRGREVRVRGVLENRGGPALTITDPGVIEVLDEGRRL